MRMRRLRNCTTAQKMLWVVSTSTKNRFCCRFLSRDVSRGRTIRAGDDGVVLGAGRGGFARCHHPPCPVASTCRLFSPLLHTHTRCRLCLDFVRRMILRASLCPDPRLPPSPPALTTNAKHTAPVSGPNQSSISTYRRCWPTASESQVRLESQNLPIWTRTRECRKRYSCSAVRRTATVPSRYVNE